MTGLICCTMDCNLACEYCFEGNGKNRCYPNIKLINQKFEDGIDYFDTYIDEIYSINNSRTTKMIFHGGEPLLIKDYNLRKVMERQKEKQHNILWSLQTNGTLINEQYITLFKEFSVSVGVSIDGLKDQHNKYRVFKNGNPTFDIVFNNLKKMLESGIHCGILATISNINIGNLIEFYELFADKDVNFSFNALYPNVNNNKAELTSGEYAKAICGLFDYWISDENHNMSIRPFERIIQGFVKPEFGNPGCHWSKDCSKGFVAIDSEGKLYPCEHWVGNKEFCFGNIDDGLIEALKKNTGLCGRTDYLADSDCRDCKIFKYCYGGCPWNAYVSHGTVFSKDEDVCEARRIIIDHIYNYVAEHLGK